MKNMYCAVITVISGTLLLLGCVKSGEPVIIDDSDWKYIQTPAFVISAPANWRYIDRKSVAAKQGYLTNFKDTLEFDFGPRADTFKPDESLFSVSYEVIDGKPAKIMTGIAEPHAFGVVFDTVTIEPAVPVDTVKAASLIQISTKQISQTKILEMFRSIKFSD